MSGLQPAWGYTACIGLHSMHWVTQYALGYTACIGLHSIHWATRTACIGLHSTACTELKSMHWVTACPVAHPVCSCNMISFSGSVTVYYDILGSLLTHIPSLTSPYIHSVCVCACSRMCVHVYMYACRHMCVGVGAHVGVWGVWGIQYYNGRIIIFEVSIYAVLLIL